MELPEPTAFAMTSTTHGDITLLTLHGKVAAEFLLPLRDKAFTAIGTRPRLLCVDARQVTEIDIALLQTLVTISRVARMVQVQFCLDTTPVVAQMLHNTGLARMLPPPPFAALSPLYNGEDGTDTSPPA